MASATALATETDSLRKEFEQWAILTYTDHAAIVNDKKGADRGVDGIAYFYSQPTETSKLIFQVKSGAVKRSDVATLNGDLQRTGASVGFLITLKEPTRDMKLEAKSSGLYIHPLSGKAYDRIQIVTIRDIVENGKRIELPLNLEVLRAYQRKTNQMELALTAPKPEKKSSERETSPVVAKRRAKAGS